MAGNPDLKDLNIHDMWMAAIGVDRTVLARHGFNQMVHGAVAKAMQQSKPATPAAPANAPAPSPARRLINAGPGQRSPIASANGPIASKAEGAGKIPAFGGTSEPQKLRGALTALEKIKQVGGMYEMIVGGNTVRLTEADYKTAVAKTRDAMHTSLAQLRTRVEYAIEGLEKQSQIDHETLRSRAVSGVVGFVGDVKRVAIAAADAVQGRESQDDDNSEEEITELAQDALKSIESSQKQLDQGRFIIAGDLLTAADTRARSVEKMYNQHHKDLISNGETAIKGLEYTVTAAAVTLAVTATIVTAGGAAGVSLGAASTANVIALAAPVVADVAEAGAKVAYGQKVDLLQLGVEVVVTAIVGKFAPKLAKGISVRLVRLYPAAASLGVNAVAGIVGGVLVGRGAAAFQAAANTAVLRYRNKDVTWGTLVDQTRDAVFDPKSAGLDLILSAINVAGASRAKPLGGSPRPEAPPQAVPVPAAAPNPPTVKPPIDMGRTSQNGRNVDVPVFGFFSYGSICRKIEAWLLLLKFHPASASSPPNWLNRNPCAAARFPNASSSAARRAALAPAIPRPATVLTRA